MSRVSMPLRRAKQVKRGKLSLLLLHPAVPAVPTTIRRDSSFFPIINVHYMLRAVHRCKERAVIVNSDTSPWLASMCAAWIGGLLD